MFSSVTSLVVLVAPILYVLGALNALHAVWYVRSPRSVIAWVIALIAMPYVAMPFYWIFGRYKFMGYIAARRAGDQKIHQTARRIIDDLARFAPDPPIEPYDQTRRLGERLAGLPFTRCNEATLLIDGEQTFGAIFDAIEAAKHYVILQFFIVRDDDLGEAFKQRLLHKTREGVTIYFLYDEVGSKDLSRTYIKTLRAAGVQMVPFHSTKGWRNRFQFNFRNHRKIVLVDGNLAFVGGQNIGDEYVGKSGRFGPWRDTCLRVAGPAVQAIQVAFVEDWHWATKELPELQWKIQPASTSDKIVLVLPTSPADELETCHLAWLRAINAATKRLWIASPYFVPDHAIVSALQLAALRGVDVRIMLPQNPDHLVVYLAAFSYLSDIQRVGVKVYKYRSGFMHQKVLLVDNRIGAVGTANLDNRSFYLNFELVLIVADTAFATEIAHMLEKDFAECEQVSVEDYERRSLLFKIAVRLARIFSPIG